MRRHYRYLPPPGPQTEQVCLLDRETALRRKEPPDAIYEQARVQDVTEDGSELRFDARPGLWQRISTFIDEESECCPFFSFEEWEESGEIVLRIGRLGREESR